MMFRFLEEFFFGGTSKFYPFEILILESVISAISGEKNLLLKQQLAVINLIQRHGEGREVNLYQMKSGKAAFDENLRIPDALEERLLARVSLKLPPKKDELNAEIWMTKGRIFSLEFDKRPKRFFEGTNVNDARPAISEVVICDDFSK